MSMNTCNKCENVYDTDYQMEEINGEMVCDRCWEDNEEDLSRRSPKIGESHED